MDQVVVVKLVVDTAEVEAAAKKEAAKWARSRLIEAVIESAAKNTTLPPNTLAESLFRGVKFLLDNKLVD